MIKEKLELDNGENLETSYDVEDLIKLVKEEILCKDEIRAIFLCKEDKGIRQQMNTIQPDLTFLLDKKQKDEIATKKFRDEQVEVDKGNDIPKCAVFGCVNYADHVLRGNVVMLGDLENISFYVKVCEECHIKIPINCINVGFSKIKKHQPTLEGINNKTMNM